MLRWFELIERIGRMQGFENASTTVNKDFRPNARTHVASLPALAMMISSPPG
jgi:hypothetical protein